MGTDLTPPDQNTDVVKLSEQEAAVAAQIQADISDDDLVIPQLKLAQGQSDSVVKGDAEAGDWVIPLTGENFGQEIDFVVVDTFRGHFWRDEDDNAHGTQEELVPWSEHPCYGQPFSQCGEAEEKFREDVNAGVHEWGDGPAISETVNFIGFVVGPDGGSDVPVKLSLMRKAKQPANKLLTYIKRMSKTPWERAYKVGVSKLTKGRYSYFVPDIDRGREATVDERSAAVNLALSIRRDQVQVVTPDEDADDNSAPAAPATEREGALDV